MNRPYTCLSLCSGIGGGALGFQQAGFELIGGIDVWKEAIEDYRALTGSPGHVADLAELEPHELRELVGPRRPDVVFTSPPCRAFSACLPASKSKTAKYVNLSSLSERGVWLVLEAWDEPPPIILLENVPRIQSRGRKWLDGVCDLLRAYGYAVKESTHDCGELGGLGQSRRRFLLIARHIEQVGEFIYEPPRRPIRGCGQVLDLLPIPRPKARNSAQPGGPMHALGKLSALNWLRLALIPAGKDWRALPEHVAVRQRLGRHNGGYGVERWSQSAHSVVGHADVANTRSAVADPRLGCHPRATVFGVNAWHEPSGTVIGHACHDNGCFSIADPRVTCRRREGSEGVTAWDRRSTTVIANASHFNGPWQVADHRSSLYTHCLLERDGLTRCVGPPLDHESKKACSLVIRALDGTWHRPMTTMELFALQGFPLIRDGDWVTLEGKSHKRWRLKIGNAVPPPAARAIAETIITTLDASNKNTLLLSGHPVWVDRHRPSLAP